MAIEVQINKETSVLDYFLWMISAWLPTFLAGSLNDLFLLEAVAYILHPSNDLE